MTATILDTKTGARFTVDGATSWEWAENNWSCDCNRHPGIDTGKPDDVCEGSERFLVIKAFYHDSDEEFTLEELNQCYPEKLLKKHGIIGK